MRTVRTALSDMTDDPNYGETTVLDAVEVTQYEVPEQILLEEYEVYDELLADVRANVANTILNYVDAFWRDNASAHEHIWNRAEFDDVHLQRELNSEIPASLQAFANDAGEDAQTMVYLVRKGDLIGAFAMADVVRAERYGVVDALHDIGIEVAMLTGDSRDVADAVAEELGIDTVFAEVLPEDKDKKVQELQDRGQFVSMVGDGVNDAPGLIWADIGIAIGSGTDVAVQDADIILVQNNRMDVVRLMELSKARYRMLQENIVWEAGYNVFAIPLAAGVLTPIGSPVSPAVGALLMSLSTVIVVINAQLLRRIDLSLPSLSSASSMEPARPAD